MAQKRKNHRKNIKQRVIRRSWPKSVAECAPNASTIFHSRLFNEEAYDNLEKVMPKLKRRVPPQHKSINQIQEAETPEALLDLAHEATGLAAFTWHRQAQQFEPDKINPLISDKLRTITGIQDRDKRIKITETLISELRWRDNAGTEILMERFDDLDYYGRSLACVVLGLLGVQVAEDKIWNFYQKVIKNWQERFFIGALWGLIDLKNEHIPDTLLHLLVKNQYFFELYGFLSLAGNEDAIAPLMVEVLALPDDEKYGPIVTISGIGHRIGREALIAAILDASQGDNDFATNIADDMLARPVDEIENFFDIFYKGLADRDMEQELENMGYLSKDYYDSTV